ncbi:MAG: hypothetical protein OQJ89_13530, partial [Kangiellaceae bacterium]|nr:hypothetical protein [Kangiellaceae bacterium]
ATTLTMARDIALKNGVRYAYTGNTYDKKGQSTYCHDCGKLLIGRDWYSLSDWNLTVEGKCCFCNTKLAGQFDSNAGSWGPHRLPISIN